MLSPMNERNSSDCREDAALPTAAGACLDANPAIWREIVSRGRWQMACSCHELLTTGRGWFCLSLKGGR